MDFTRTLRLGMSGADVRYIKESLLQLGSFGAGTKEITADVFDLNTLWAVLGFQLRHRGADGSLLFPNGAVDQKTWDAVEAARTDDGDEEPGGGETDGPADGEDKEPEDGGPADDGAGEPGDTGSFTMPKNIGFKKAAAIKQALQGVSELRQSIVLEALRYAVDPDMPGEYPLSLYIRAGNLYNTDLKPNVITAARIESGAKKQPQYYDKGRKEMMLAAVKADPAITGADCSGAVVGILRYFGLVKPSFDQTADSLSSNSYSAAVDKAKLSPGDWVGRSQHIGFYAGAGYVVEWMGGAYGCQLSELDARAGWSFVENAMVEQSPFTRYRRPRYY